MDNDVDTFLKLRYGNIEFISRLPTVELRSKALRKFSNYRNDKNLNKEDHTALKRRAIRETLLEDYNEQ